MTEIVISDSNPNTKETEINSNQICSRKTKQSIVLDVSAMPIMEYIHTDLVPNVSQCKMQFYFGDIR